MFTVFVSLAFLRAVGAVTNNQSVGAKSIDTENRTRSVGVSFRCLVLITVPAGRVREADSRIASLFELLFGVCLWRK